MVVWLQTLTNLYSLVINPLTINVFGKVDPIQVLVNGTFIDPGAECIEMGGNTPVFSITNNVDSRTAGRYLRFLKTIYLHFIFHTQLQNISSDVE